MSRVVEAIGFLHNVGWGWRKRRERKGRGGDKYHSVFRQWGNTEDRCRLCKMLVCAL